MHHFLLHYHSILRQSYSSIIFILKTLTQYFCMYSNFLSVWWENNLKINMFALLINISMLQRWTVNVLFTLLFIAGCKKLQMSQDMCHCKGSFIFIMEIKLGIVQKNWLSINILFNIVCNFRTELITEITITATANKWLKNYSHLIFCSVFL